MADEPTAPATGDAPPDPTPTPDPTPDPATPPSDPQPAPAATDEPEPTGDPSQLGDAGKRALAEERRARREADAARQKLEAQLKELQPLADKARELEESQKSEQQRIEEARDAAINRATQADQRAWRLEVALEKGLTAKQALRLVGDSKEALMEDADDLLASFAPPEKPAAAAEATPATNGAAEKTRRPTEQLKPGAAPDIEPGVDYENLAGRIFEGRH